MLTRALALTFALLASAHLAAQPETPGGQPPRFDRRFGPQPAEPPTVVHPRLVVPPLPQQQPPAEGPRFGERFGPPEPPGELTPPQPPVSGEPLPLSTQRLASSDIERDVARLPAPVRTTRDRLIAAARSGDLAAVARLVADNPVRVQLDADPVDDPAALWRQQYPDSQGREVLGLLLNLLDQPFVRVEAGTPNEMFVWPAYAQLPLDRLAPGDLVEVYRLVTGYDLQQMREGAAWTFFRLGIAPDGALHYFVAGE
jgi:hypothetical protein